MTDDRLKRYAELIDRMLHAQQEYFRTRSNSALEAAKRLEKQARKETADILAGERQETLFER
jgi:hypothetical protein